MTEPLITIITPTTGAKSLNKLIESIDSQTVPCEHIVLWDDKREDDYLYPDPQTMQTKNPHDLNFDVNRISIVVKGRMVQGKASGSSLRAIGLMAAKTQYVTFADSDVWLEKDHFEKMLKAIEGRGWAYCKRKIWTENDDKLECLGIDEFESVGDSTDRKVPYEMVDNNCMMFDRRFGTSGAVLYRETKEYDDDRNFYAFLKKHAGIPGKLNEATVNQVCPKRLEPMFREYCTRD